MLLLDTINEGTESRVEDVKNELKSKGWSDSEISSIESHIRSGVQADITEEEMQDIVDESEGDAKDHLIDILSQRIDMEVNQINESRSDGYIVQDAEKSLIQPEPVSVAGGPTLPDSKFSIDQDNSDSYNFVDEAKNWFKVNKKSGTVEALLSNGSMIKLDGKGNATVRISGSLKKIIDGDYLQDVRGNMIVKVGGSMSVESTSISEKSSSHSIDGGSNLTLNASIININ